MKITLQRQNDEYGRPIMVPLYDTDLDWCKKLKVNEVVIAEIRRARNPKYHRYAFKMLHILYDMVDEPLSFEPWRKLLLIKAGFFTAIGTVSVDGSVRQAVEAQSMRYEAMDEDEFHDTFRALLQAFINKYQKDITYDQLVEWSLM